MVPDKNILPKGIPAGYAIKDSLLFRMNHMYHGLFQNIHNMFII